MNKKRSVLVFSLCLGILLLCASFASSSQPQSGPVLYYEFNKADFIGPDAKVPNSAAGYSALKGEVFEGADVIPTIYQTGGIAIFNNAISDKGYISTADNDALDMGTSDNIAISFWTRGSWRDNSILLSKMDYSTGKGYEIAGTNPANPNFAKRLDFKMTEGASSWTIGLGISDTNVWNHVVFVISRNGGSKVFLNGAEVTSATGNALNNKDISNSKPLVLGADQTSPYSRFFNGYLDEFMIYKRTLSPSEISSLYTTQKDTSRGATLYINRVYLKTAGSGIYTVPSSVHTLGIEVVGGGGEGSGFLYYCEASGAGAGGGYTYRLINAVPGQTFNYVVGKGGPDISDCIAPKSTITYAWDGYRDPSTWGITQFPFDINTAGDGQPSSFVSGGLTISAGAGTGAFHYCIAGGNQYPHQGSSLFAVQGFTPWWATGQDLSNSIVDPAGSDQCKHTGVKSGYAFSKGQTIGGGAAKYGGSGKGDSDEGGGCGGGPGADGLIVITEYYAAGAVAPVVPSTSCSSDNQIIMRLFSNTYSHASDYTDQNAPIKICYDTLFPNSPDPGQTPRTCSGSNKVVGLTSTTNAHAENPELTNYLTPICYAGLSCTLRENSCAVGETAVVSLSDNTNAHLALGTDATYTKKICCTRDTTSSAEKVTQVEWLDAAGNHFPNPVIPTASLTDSVTLWGDSTYPPNTQIIAQVFKENVKTAINAFITTTDNNGEITTGAKSLSDIVANQAGPEDQIYFKMGKLGSPLDPPTSEYLNITGVEVVWEKKCIADGKKIQNIISGVNSGVPVSTMEGEPGAAQARCTGPFVPGGNDKEGICCPTGYTCGTQGCKLVYLTCGEITEANCKGDLSATANNDPAKAVLEILYYNGLCQNRTFNCVWTGTTCGISAVYSDKPILPVGCTPTTCVQDQCVYSTEAIASQECNGEYKIVNLNATRIEGDCDSTHTVLPCEDKPNVRIPCGRSLAILPFFGIWQAIGVIVIVFVIYSIWLKTKGKQKSRRRK